MMAIQPFLPLTEGKVFSQSQNPLTWAWLSPIEALRGVYRPPGPHFDPPQGGSEGSIGLQRPIGAHSLVKQGQKIVIFHVFWQKLTPTLIGPRGIVKIDQKRPGFDRQNRRFGPKVGPGGGTPPHRPHWTPYRPHWTPYGGSIDPPQGQKSMIFDEKA